MAWQAHSLTSKDGYDLAEAEGTITNQKTRILQLINDVGATGLTGLEISKAIGLSDGRISARIRSLEQDNQIIRTAMVRNRGNIVVGRTYYHESMGKAATKDDYKAMFDALREEKDIQDKLFKRCRNTLYSYAHGSYDGGIAARQRLQEIEPIEGERFA